MSCSSCGNNECSGSCNPCKQTFNNESLASSLQNLILQLFGTFTETTVNGRSVWSALCSAETAGIPCFPKSEDEGFVCYFIRILGEIGLFAGGDYNGSLSYCKNTIVASGSSLYVALQTVPVGIAPGNTSYWQLLLTAPAGAAGPQGPSGTSGGGSAVNYATRTTAVTVTLGDTDAILFCEPSGAMAVNLPLISGALAGKWFEIWTNGASNVTITPNGTDKINFNNTLVSTLVLGAAGSSIKLVSNNAGEWRIF
jgi:hypothetical protein